MATYKSYPTYNLFGQQRITMRETEMRSEMLKQLACAALLGAALGGAGAAEHVAVKRPVDIPPSADLSYSIKARQKGFSISGDAVVSWRAGAGKYSLRADTRAMFVGKILENRSEGLIDGFGIAPTQFYEKRIRHDPYTTTFDRAAKAMDAAATTPGGLLLALAVLVPGRGAVLVADAVLGRSGHAPRVPAEVPDCEP